MISKRLLIAVIATCLYAVGMAVFAFYMGVDRGYIWLCAISVVASIAMARYAKDICDDYKNQEVDIYQN